MQGYADGTYEPANPVTRDQMAVSLARSVATPTGEAGLASYTPPAIPSFTDVPRSYWAYKHIEYAKSHALVQGYAHGSYQPGNPVARAQMAVFLRYAFSLPLPSQSIDLANYLPLAEGSTWAYEEEDDRAHASKVSGTVTRDWRVYAKLLADAPGLAASYLRLDSEGILFGGKVTGDDQTLIFTPPFLLLRPQTPTGATTHSAEVTGTAVIPATGTLQYRYLGLE